MIKITNERRNDGYWDVTKIFEGVCDSSLCTQLLLYRLLCPSRRNQLLQRTSLISFRSSRLSTLRDRGAHFRITFARGNGVESRFLKGVGGLYDTHDWFDTIYNKKTQQLKVSRWTLFNQPLTTFYLIKIGYSILYSSQQISLSIPQ